MSDVMDAYWAAPSLARTVATAILLTSIGVLLGFPSYAQLYFTEDRLWRFPPEVWRIFTSFLLASPQLGIILEPYFAYQYLSQLEMSHPRFLRKEDLLWYLLTVGAFIIFLNRIFTGNAFFLQGLITALCYTSVQDQRGVKAGFFFFTVPAQLVPYCMLLASLLMSPGLLPLQITGIVAAHMYDFLTRIYPEFGGGPNFLATPTLVSRLINSPRFSPRFMGPGYGTAVRNNTRPAGAGSGASTGSFFQASWRSRGSGHRLGGD